MDALRALYAKFFVEADDKQLKHLDAGVEGMIEKIKNFSTVAAGAFAGREIFNFVKEITNSAKELKEHANIIGINYGELQSWNYAAKVAGTSAESLGAAFARLSTGKFEKPLKEIGVATKNADGTTRDATDIMGDFAEALDKINDPGQRNAAAMAVLGRNYRALLPLLLQGKEGISELREEFRQMGGGFTEDFAKRSEDLHREINRVQGRWELLKIFMADQLLPYVERATKAMVKWSGVIVQLAHETNFLQVAFALFAVQGIEKVIKALGGLGQAVKTLAAILIAEDIWSFFRGGDSVTGDILQKVFPPETVEWLRTSIPGVFAHWKDGLDLFFLATGYDLMKVGTAIEDQFTQIWDGMLTGIQMVIHALGALYDAASSNPIAKVLGVNPNAGKEWADKLNANVESHKDVDHEHTEDAADETFHKEMNRIEGQYNATEEVNQAHKQIVAARMSPTSGKSDVAFAEQRLAEAKAAANVERFKSREQFGRGKVGPPAATDAEKASAKQFGGATPPPGVDKNFNTILTVDQEKAFWDWKAKNGPGQKSEDYDMRGAFVAGEAPSSDGHWSDKFKKPNHPTFSNESKYYNTAPDRAGRWEGEKFIPPPMPAVKAEVAGQTPTPPAVPVPATPLGKSLLPAKPGKSTPPVKGEPEPPAPIASTAPAGASTPPVLKGVPGLTREPAAPLSPPVAPISPPLRPVDERPARAFLADVFPPQALEAAEQSIKNVTAAVEQLGVKSGDVLREQQTMLPLFQEFNVQLGMFRDTIARFPQFTSTPAVATAPTAQVPTPNFGSGLIGPPSAPSAGNTDVNSQTHITVNVPPGTPDSMAERTGDAVAKVTKRGSYAAIAPGGGS